MKRLLAFVVCALAVAAATISCGGGGDSSDADKLTIVGSGS